MPRYAIAEEVHEADRRDYPLTLDQADHSGEPWDAEDDRYILGHLRMPARDVALELGRTLWAVRQRRSFLTRRSAEYSPRNPRAGMKSRYRHRYLPGHPLAGARGLVAEHRAVLFDRIGPGPHPCHWCGAPIEWRVGARDNQDGDLIAHRLDGDRENNDPDNLVPSCLHCNAVRTSRRPIEPGEPYVLTSRGQRTRAVRRVCERCGVGFLRAPNTLSGNRGRFCSHSCAMLGNTLARGHVAPRVWGEDHPKARLSEADVVAILRADRSVRGWQEVLARTYGVGQPTISNIVRGATWKHVPRP